MKLVLIVLLSLSGAKKEAIKRWPPGLVHFKIDYSGLKNVYEMDVTILRREPNIFGAPKCRNVTRLFIGKDWKDVMEQSKDFISDCSALERF